MEEITNNRPTHWFNSHVTIWENLRYARAFLGLVLKLNTIYSTHSMNWHLRMFSTLSVQNWFLISLMKAIDQISKTKLLLTRWPCFKQLMRRHNGKFVVDIHMYVHHYNYTRYNERRHTPTTFKFALRLTRRIDAISKIYEHYV